jgi:hypothetical protein
MVVYRSPEGTTWATKETDYMLADRTKVLNTVTLEGKEGYVIKLSDISLFLWNESDGHVASACFTFGSKRLAEMHTASSKPGKTYGKLDYTGDVGAGIDLDFHLKTSYEGYHAMLTNVVFAYEYVAASTEEEPVTDDPGQEPEVNVKETIVKISCASESVAEELVKKLKEKIPSESDVFISYVN